MRNHRFQPQIQLTVGNGGFYTKRAKQQKLTTGNSSSGIEILRKPRMVARFQGEKQPRPNAHRWRPSPQPSMSPPAAQLGCQRENHCSWPASPTRGAIPLPLFRAYHKIANAADTAFWRTFCASFSHSRLQKSARAQPLRPLEFREALLEALQLLARLTGTPELDVRTRFGNFRT